MKNFKNKIILITGAGSGLGRHLAGVLGSYGAAIAVNDINPDRTVRTVQIVEQAGGRANSYFSDIAKKFPVQALFNAVEDDWGRLDAVINNARVVPHKPLLDMDEWDWRRTLDVNLTGAFVLAQVGSRIMRTGGGGLFIQPVQAISDTVNTAAYQASISGVDRMISMARDELLKDGIHAHSVPYKDNDYKQATDTIVELLDTEINPE